MYMSEFCPTSYKYSPYSTTNQKKGVIVWWCEIGKRLGMCDFGAVAGNGLEHLVAGATHLTELTRG